MPELPEVETTRRGVMPWIKSQQITDMSVRQASLRWPVTDGIEERVKGQRVVDVTRRAKYLIIKLEKGSMLVHPGMSLSLIHI